MGFFDSLFPKKAHACEQESYRWRQCGRAARRAGMHKLAADCDGYSRQFADAASSWRRSGQLAHQADLRASGQDVSKALRPTRTKGHSWG